MMIHFLAAVMMWVGVTLSAAECFTGTLSQYDQRPTDQVLHNRTIPGRTAHTLPAGWREVDGYIAARDCTDIGEIWTVAWRGHQARLMVFDCAGHRAAYQWMTRYNILGEVDYYTARAWQAQPLRGLTKATVCKP